MVASNLSTLSRRIIILLLYTDCQSDRTAAIAHHVNFAQITCFNLKDCPEPEKRPTGPLHCRLCIVSFCATTL